MRPSMIGRLLLGAILALVPASTFAGSNWDRFRGPNGTGVVTDQEVPVQWSEKDGILWKVALPGLGNCSPVIRDNKLFLQSATEDGKERLLLCLDASTGKTLWQQKVTANKARTHAKNSLASSTPAVDGERVYVLFWDGEAVALHAYSVDGKPVWQRPLGEFKSQHGPGTSPIVWQNLVFLNNDQDGKAILYAFDAKTGKTVWQADRPPFRACYSMPFLLEHGKDSPELILGSTAGVTSYDPKTGTQNWHWTWAQKDPKKPLRTIASPVYLQGMIFATGGDGDGRRHAVAIKLEGQGTNTSTHLAWQNSSARPFPYVPCFLPFGEYLYFVNDRGQACCCVARTGEIVWDHQITQAISASPVLVDGKVYAVSEDGICYVFAASPTYKLLAKNPLGEAVIASPAVADNRLYIRGRNHLFCIARPLVK